MVCGITVYLSDCTTELH